MTQSAGAFRLFTSSLATTIIKAPALFLLAAPFIGIGFLLNNYFFGLSAAVLEFDYLIERDEWPTIAASVGLTTCSISAAYGFIAAYLLNARKGRRFQISACLFILSRRLFRLTISQFVAMIVLMFSFVTLAGGLWLSGLWAVSAIVVIVEPGEGMGFNRSVQLTKNHRWSLGIASTGIILASSALSIALFVLNSFDLFYLNNLFEKAKVFGALIDLIMGPMFLAPFAVLTYQRLVELADGTPTEIEEIFR
jgi:hypothetical protein